MLKKPQFNHNGGDREMSTSNIVVSTPAFTTDSWEQRAGTCVDLYCNIATALRLNNQAVFQQMWRFVNSGADVSVSTSNVYNSSTVTIYSNSGTVNTYLKLANDFAGFNCGLFVNQTTNTGNSNNQRSSRVVGIMPCALEGQVVDTREKFTSLTVMVPTTANYYRYVTKQATGYFEAILELFKVYSYSGSNIAFIAPFGLRRSVIFSYAKSISNPNDIKPIYIVMATHNGSNDSSDAYDASTGLNIDPNVGYVDIYFDDNRFISKTYTSMINKYSNVHNKLILYKFTHNGYYCDNIFTYEGELPYEHFVYNNEEYVRVAYNLILKLT